MKNKIIILFSVFLFSFSVFSQTEKDSTFKAFNFSLGVGWNNHFPGGEFYKGFVASSHSNYNGYNSLYDNIITHPIMDYTLGYKSSATTFHYTSFAFGISDANSYSTVGATNANLKYLMINYKFNYQFFTESKFPLKPFGGFNFVYSKKDYSSN